MSTTQPTPNGRLSRQEQVIEGELVGHPAMPRPVEKALTTAVAKQYARGIVGTARVRSVHYVASHALRALADLEVEEAAAVARNQFTGGCRQRRIVDTALAAFDEAVYTTGQAFA